jgi:hypothetical protein
LPSSANHDAAPTATGNQQESVTTQPPSNESLANSVSPTNTPDFGDTSMTPTIPANLDPNMQKLVDMAKEDLEQRLSISPTQIKMVEVTQVEWADSSLGCPQPGMSYLQVITPGYRIVLEVNGSQYEYHSNRGTNIIYCPNPSSPDFGSPNQ